MKTKRVLINKERKLKRRRRRDEQNSTEIFLHQYSIPIKESTIEL